MNSSMNNGTAVHAARWPVWIVAGPVLLFGLFIAIGGVRLVALGGSSYFRLAGFALAAAAIVMFRGFRPMSVHRSGACRSRIPEHVGPGFRSMSVHHSGPCRSSWGSQLNG